MSNRIKVLQCISSTGFYGADSWVWALGNQLDRNIVRNDLLVTTEENAKDLEVSAQFRRQCGEVFELHLKHKLDFLVLRGIVKLIKERKIDIIHTHNYKSDLLGLLAARITGIKCLITPHGYDDPENTKLRFYNSIDKRILRYADALAPLSPQLLEECDKANVEKTKIRFIQNGVDLTEVDAIRNSVSKSESETKKIGYIGQFISRKNIYDIIDIFKRLCDIMPKLELYLIGDGEERGNLEKYADGNTKIKFLGFRSDRLELLRQLDLFLMTSKLEGIPRCLMEASAMGVPIAAYNIPGVDKLIAHGETGLLADYKDLQQMVEHSKCLLTNISLRNRIISNARANIEKNFSSKRMASEYIDLYQSLVNA